MKSRRKKLPEINASSMADIVFLLLIFFLVTTTISSDKGLVFVLPEISDSPDDVVKVKGVVNIILNNDNAVMLGRKNQEEETSMLQIKAKLLKLKREIEAQGNSIIVSVKTTEKSSYKNYIEIIDQIRSANITKVSLAQ